MTDEDGWNADAAAARALGEMADGRDVGRDAPAADAGEDPAPDDAPQGDAESDESGSSGGTFGIAGVLLSLVSAPPSGPSVDGFRSFVDDDTAHILDGAVDWILDVAGLQGGPVDDVRDDLGPLGKMGRGLSGFMTTPDDDGGGDTTGDDDAGGGGGAPDMAGVNGV